jgi:hypothetical protein
VAMALAAVVVDDVAASSLVPAKMTGGRARYFSGWPRAACDNVVRVRPKKPPFLSC